jgi:hypothetical protein
MTQAGSGTAMNTTDPERSQADAASVATAAPLVRCTPTGWAT